MPEQLLKLHFGKKQSGKWAIQFMQPIRLRGQDSANANFFSIQEDIFFAQPNFVGTTKHVLGQSIVPIVAQVRGEQGIRCLGTGFFISCSGLLITAAHVITDPIERQYGGTKEIEPPRVPWRPVGLSQAANAAA